MQPGDIGLCHSLGFLPRLIRVMQRLRYHNGRPCARWSHAFMLVEPVSELDGDGWRDWVIIEAESKGVQFSWLSQMGEYVILDSGQDQRGRELALRFADRALGSKYGFFTLLSIAVNLILPTSWQVTRTGTFICSGLVAHALEHGGYIFPLKWEADEVMPADLACLFRPVANG